MIDLRSDVCAPPTEAMWEAMRTAPLGWASGGDDPTVALLEERGAALLAAEAALWLPSCTMANIAALLVLTRPGERVIAEAAAHILVNEGDGLSLLARLEPEPLAAADGRLGRAQLAEALSGTRASLVCLENSHTRAGGTVLDAAATEALAGAAHEAGARLHLDGARLANAAVALGVPLSALAAPADTVSFSLNKALGAPVGALLAGERATVAAARRVSRRLGGATLHKAGMLAAAGLVALDEMGPRLAADHRRARLLAQALRRLGVVLEPDVVETNIVTLVPAAPVEAALAQLAGSGVLALSLDGRRLRLVTHAGFDDEAIEPVAAAVAAAAAAPQVEVAR